MSQLNEATLPIGQLLLDPNNYRFQASDEFVRVRPERFAEPSVQLKAQTRLRDESLRTLKASILANGFVPVERLVVRKLDDDKYLVLEGNRRLAALRWIQEEHAAGSDVNPSVIQACEGIPVMVVEGGEDEALYSALMGIRHVSGIKQWKGYERAQLVVQLIDKHELDSGEVADRLGMGKVEVNRRYRAMKALKQMSESEDFGEYASPGKYPLFHEALSLPILRNWLNWDDDAHRFEDSSELESFYTLISPRPAENEDEDERPAKLATYADVRLLRDLLSNETATRMLLDPERDLAEAVAVVRTGEVSRAWRAQVARTIESLETMALDQVTNLEASDLRQLQKLKDSADKVVSSHKRLSSE